MEGNEMGLSRRNFLKGAGLAAIGAAAATSLGGCASSESSADWMPSKWDFETDALPQAQVDDQGQEIYQETKLYAKWIKN